MRDQIFPDDALDFTALTRGEFVCTRTLRQGNGEQGHAGGDGQAQSKGHGILPVH
jgi:hypothetical protein